jgi:hypothetical protein
MTQNESAIEQINLGYNDQEDRLLLRLGLADKTEIAVWITRRICKVMWGLLQGSHSMTLPVSTPLALPSNKMLAMESFAQEAAKYKKIENLDFKSEYIVERQTRSEVPMLAVQCIVISSEKPPAELVLQCTQDQSVKLALTNELVYAVSSMMQLATREAGWDLLMTSKESQMTLNLIHEVLH